MNESCPARLFVGALPAMILAVSLYSQRAGTRSLKLVAPWAGGQGAYVGKSIFIPGGAGNVGQFGESRTQFGSYKHS